MKKKAHLEWIWFAFVLLILISTGCGAARNADEEVVRILYQDETVCFLQIQTGFGIGLALKERKNGSWQILEKVDGAYQTSAKAEYSIRFLQDHLAERYRFRKSILQDAVQKMAVEISATEDVFYGTDREAVTAAIADSLHIAFPVFDLEQNMIRLILEGNLIDEMEPSMDSPFCFVRFSFEEPENTTARRLLHDAFSERETIDAVIWSMDGKLRMRILLTNG